MTRHSLRHFSLFLLALFVLPAAAAVRADSSHARIIRLSLLQGDVRFTRDAHGDPLSDTGATWETAILNLPIRQGYVVATDNGRAEIEFENGAMVFLNEHSVLEFYDLSLNDGALTTRLILRQGTISAYVHPGSDDYFSVTGGDFTVEATSRANFRVDNFDDGSSVSVLTGRVSVVHKNETSPLEKNQTLSMRAGDDAVAIDRLGNEDGFDKWVSGRIDAVSTATNASLHYVNSPYYSSGFSDLATYGSWFAVGGFGNCWRPYGVGLGWSPFDTGSWYYDPFVGWSFVGFEPWGWAPYHYGSWIFSRGLGWVWVPSGFGYRGMPWRPVTAVFVHAGNSVGLVPLHPTDRNGKKPVNIAEGVMPVPGGKISGTALPINEKWRVLKAAPREVLASNVAKATAPQRVSQHVEQVRAGAAPSSATSPRATRSTTIGATADGKSSITYDSREHRYVNANNEPASATAKTPSSASAPSTEIQKETTRASGEVDAKRAATERGAVTAVTAATAAAENEPRVPRAPVIRTVIVPPPATHGNGSNNAGMNPAHGNSAATAPAPSSAGRPLPAPAPRTSTPAPMPAPRAPAPAPAPRASSPAPAPAPSGGRPR
ncbi:MAG TPA: FecR family protein [Candidatus Dormibacteraeota bacterium]|nr:FecR family protein [Candidatus Dormibacteraeota bacterium]